ncbi:aminoacyl-tRNA hydrolase [Corynebacterium halotolerans]|uniref:aminoacyl-tRNA hydrolase n=1 Tax=Corynebacterium halotolerans TaxID=225326 RepID=UPI003CE79945
MTDVFSFRALWSRLTGGSDRSRPSPAAAPTLSAADLSPQWLVVGLGNPGDRYAATRHNVGYMALDDLLAADGEVLTPLNGFKAEVAQVDWDGESVLLVRSTTFMNLSGEAVAPLCRKYGISPDHVVVLHDELDLPKGKLRVRLGGNENGHNGLKSTSEQLGTRDYLRVRIGISRPPKGMAVPEYVLGPVGGGAELDAAIATAARAARLLVTEGLARAQNQIHAK